MTVIDVKALSKRYAARTGSVSALEDISFAVGEGEFVAVVGPSGCGKSTLLKILSGILPASAAGERIEVKMTLTAPGCGMGGAIAADAQAKIASVPGVAEAEVQVVWDPPWSAEMMTPEGKRLLGIA